MVFCVLRLDAAAAVCSYFSDGSARLAALLLLRFSQCANKVHAHVKYERVRISIFFVVPAVLLYINQNLKYLPVHEITVCTRVITYESMLGYPDTRGLYNMG